MKYLYLGILLFALSACTWPSEVDPEKIAYGEQIISQAEQDALDAEQARIEAANLEVYRQERRVYWGKVWGKVFGAVVAGAYFFALSVFFSGSVLAWNIQRAASHIIMIRASILPVQANGARPALVFPETKSLLESITYDKAFRITDTKYHLVDTQTGEHCTMNLDKLATSAGLEILRQAINIYLPSKAQVQSSLTAPKGGVARHIGETSIQLPGPSIIDLEEVKRSYE